MSLDSLRKAIRQFFEGKDLPVVLTKCVLVAGRAEARNFACLAVIIPLTSIANDQIV